MSAERAHRPYQTLRAEINRYHDHRSSSRRGAVQGVTEFLPISSTAHLRLVPLLGWPDPGAAFTAVLQLGTLAAVIVFFARDLGAMLRGDDRPLTRRAGAARGADGALSWGRCPWSWWACC